MLNLNTSTSTALIHIYNGWKNNKYNDDAFHVSVTQDSTLCQHKVSNIYCHNFIILTSIFKITNYFNQKIYLYLIVYSDRRS